MSQTTEAPPEETKTKPVGTQDSSEGKGKTSLKETSEKVHDAAVRGESPEATEEFKAAVAKAVAEMFDLNEKAWQPKTIVKFKIECPSGQTVLAKHLDTLDLLGYGLIEEMDFFTRKLFPPSIDASGNPEEEAEQESIWKSLRDPKKRQRFLDMTGKLAAISSVKPSLAHDGVAVVPELDEDGEPTGKQTTKFGYQMTMEEQLEYFKKPIPKLKSGQAYTGYLSFNDRMTYFQELNRPLSMIEPFREGSAALLQNLARSEGHGGEAE